MDFKKQLESELDKRYVDMLKGSSKPPFDKETVSNYQSFKNKNTSYHQRIDKEQREFNSALSEVTSRRNRRIEGENRAEYDRKRNKAYAKYAFAKFLKTIAILLPVVLAIFVGVDIFSNKAIYEVDHSFGWIVTGWVAFSLASLATTIALMIKLYSDESFEYEEYNKSYRSRHRDDNRKKYAITATVVTIVVCLICCINFGTYIKWGMDEVDDLALKINMMPTHEEINYSDYEYQIEEAYTLYSSFDFWQKAMLKNEDRFLNVVAGFNQYRVDNVKAAMNLITLDSVSEGDILTNAVKLYSALNEEQRALLTQEEIKLFDTFSTVSNVVDRLYEINDDVVDQYSTISDVLNIYQTIDDDYKAYVYNYDLVPAFKERYEYFEQFLFEPLEGGGYSIKLKDGKRISGELIIPERYKNENVVSIPDGAFAGNYNITSVYVPNTITQIGYEAFKGCSNITEMSLPFTGKSASASAYEAVFGYIFGYTTQTSSQKNHDQDNVFVNSQTGEVSGATWQYSCYNYSSYYSNRLQSYFYNIPASIEKVTITNQSTIKTAAFNGCKNIKNIEYSQSITSFENAAFQNCNLLKTFNSTNEGQADLTGTYTTLGAYAFKNCYLIDDIVIPSGVVTIGEYAFEKLSISKVVVPTTVETINIGAFYGCNNLTEMSLPFVGKSESASAFEGVFGYIFGYTTQTSSQKNHDTTTTFENTQTGSVDGAIWQYSCYNYSSYYSNRLQSYFYYIPSNIKHITITKQNNVPLAAFNGCSSITDVNFNSELKGIGVAAFQNCTALSKFNTETENTICLYGKNASVGDYAFAGCGLIENLLLDNNVFTIGAYAFSDCSAIKELNLTNSITSIGNYAFQNLIIPSTIVVHNSTTHIGLGAFQGCNNIISITLPFTGKSTSASAYEAVFGYIFGYTTQTSSQKNHDPNNVFVNSQTGEVSGATWQYSCYNYSSYYSNRLQSYFYNIPATIKNVVITNQSDIQIAAFNGCKNIETIEYTQTITTFGDAAFQNCNVLKTFNSTNVGQADLTGTYTTLGAYAFKNCYLIDDIIIPSGVVTIGEYAFEKLSISKVVVPTTVETINIGAFYGCNNLTEMSLPFVGKSESASAFEGVFGYIFGYTTQTSSQKNHDNTTTFENTQTGSVNGAVWQYSCYNYSSYYSNRLQSYYYYIPSALRTITITNQRKVPTAAFNGCTMLTSITYTQGVGSRGSYAFQNCNATVK